MLAPFHYDLIVLINVIFQMSQGWPLPFFDFPLTLGSLTDPVFICSHPHGDFAI